MNCYFRTFYETILSIVIFAIVLSIHAYAQSNTKSGVKPQVISLPGGPGTIEGLGESFEPQFNMGSGQYTIPVSVPPGRAGFAPSLLLVYNSGNGNSVVGMGMQFTTMCVKRQSDKGLPGYGTQQYSNPDTYINENGEELIRISGSEVANVQVFRLKNEESFKRYIYVLGEDRWVCTDSSGRTYSLGAKTDNTDFLARVKNPHNNLTYAWYVGEMIDTNGNSIIYNYIQDQRQAYCDRIIYGSSEDVPGAGHSIEFTYETRQDPIIDYRPGFRLVTAKRLKQINIHTGEKLVRRYNLEYLSGRFISLLSRITLIGTDGSSTIPPAEFQYSNHSLTVNASLLPVKGLSLASLLFAGEDPDNNPGSAEVLDFNGDSLPDLYQSRTSSSPTDEFDILYENQGNGQFKHRSLSQGDSLGLRIQSENSIVQDINGDGLPDLVAQKGDNLEDFVFRLNQGGRWEATDSPFIFSGGVTAHNVFLDPDIRIMDLNCDKQIDTLRSYRTVSKSGRGIVFEAYLNNGDGTFNNISQTTSDIVKGIPDNFTNLQGRLVLADMNGDRMQDIVQLGDSRSVGIRFWPSMGYGKFDDSNFGYIIPLTDGPDLNGSSSLISKLQLSDLNGDGLADLYYVSGPQIRYWLNEGGLQFGQESTINLKGQFDSSVATYRLLDIDGDGLQDYIDLCTNEANT